MTLEEIVAAPQLPLPANYQELTVPQRQQWFQEFQASEAGRRYQQQLEQLDSARLIVSVKADQEGKFVFENARQGNFGLYGQREFKHDGKTFIADFFAEVPITAGVRFLDLERMPLAIRRVLKPGEAAPDLVLYPSESESQTRVHELKAYSGRPVLLCFWTRENLDPIAEELDRVVREKPAEVVVLGVNLDEPSPELERYLRESPPQWQVLRSAGIQQAPVTLDYGVQALPSFCLLGSDGKVLLNDEGFFAAFGEPDATMVQVVQEAVSAATDR